MKKFKEFLNEEMMPYAQTEKGFVGVDNGPVRDNINIHLASITAKPYATPYHAMEMVRKVLAPFSIFPPSTNFLDGDSGHEIFQINQFGDKIGMTNDGQVVVKNFDNYFIYFEYQMNDTGSFDVFCEIVDEDELDEIMSDLEEEMEEGDVTDGDEADAEDSFDSYKEKNQVNEELINEITEKRRKILNQYVKNAKADRKLAISDREHYKSNLRDPDKAWTKGIPHKDSQYKMAVDRNARAMKRAKGIAQAEKKLASEETINEGRPSQRHPLEGHPYHKKSDAELLYIAKDAHKAAEAMKGHNTEAENKYADQANDSATVRYWRKKNGMPNWYKKKYGHDTVKEENINEISGPKARNAEHKSAKDYYDKYDAEADARKKYIKSKDPKDKEKADEAKKKRTKAAQRTIRFQQYADKKMQEEKRVVTATKKSEKGTKWKLISRNPDSEGSNMELRQGKRVKLRGGFYRDSQDFGLNPTKKGKMDIKAKGKYYDSAEDIMKTVKEENKHPFYDIPAPESKTPDTESKSRIKKITKRLAKKGIPEKK